MGAYISFDLLDTAELCGLDIKGRTLAKEEVEARCPYCNDHRYRMYLNRITHMFFCQNCGTGGNAVTLYADCNPKGIRLTNYESYKALSAEPSVRQYDVPITESCDEPPIRELSERSEIYLEFLKLLRLEKDHLTNLLNRGLSTEIIKGNMYKSFPTDKTERQWICDNLAARYDLTDVPGFYRSGGRWSIIGLKSGILIPICSKDNLIQGLQIRFDNPPVKRITAADGKVTEKVGGRFRWLSTGGNGFTDGTGITSYIHVTGDVSSDTLYLTEGGMKADIASYLSGGRLFIGLTGVQNVRYLKEIVTSLRPKRIVECLDMDVRTNPQVQKAQSKIQAICTPLCEEYRRFFWPKEQKGIDDYSATCSTTILIVQIALLNKM